MIPRWADVAVDVKLGGCPNPINLKAKGVLPVAVLGSADFDVRPIDVATIRLNGVAPLRSSYGDVTFNEKAFNTLLAPRVGKIRERVFVGGNPWFKGEHAVVDFSMIVKISH